MTAMSDVTVLLLTFFMLTSTFLQKEPTIVYTPSSVSEEKVPMNNLVTILVSSADKSGKLDDPSPLQKVNSSSRSPAMPTRLCPAKKFAV